MVDIEQLLVEIESIKSDIDEKSNSIKKDLDCLKDYLNSQLKQDNIDNSSFWFRQRGYTHITALDKPRDLFKETLVPGSTISIKTKNSDARVEFVYIDTIDNTHVFISKESFITIRRSDITDARERLLNIVNKIFTDDVISIISFKNPLGEENSFGGIGFIPKWFIEKYKFYIHSYNSWFKVSDKVWLDDRSNVDSGYYLTCTKDMDLPIWKSNKILPTPIYLCLK